MNRFVYFLMVGLAFTVLQISTVGAQSPSGSADPNAPVLTIGDPACITVPAAAGCPPGSPGLMGAPGMPPTGMPPMGDSCVTVPAGPDRDACYSSMSGSSMPPGGQHDGPPGMPGQHDGPTGGHHDGPPIDPRSGQPFTKADEDKYQKYADECEATRGLLSEGSTQELVAEGFTRIQVEKLCKDGPDHHDGPPGGPDGHHDGPPGMPPQ